MVILKLTVLILMVIKNMFQGTKLYFPIWSLLPIEPSVVDFTYDVMKG